MEKIILDEGAKLWLFGKVEKRLRKKSKLQKILSRKDVMYKTYAKL